MDKEYMLEVISRRIDELHKEYRACFDGVSAGADAVRRSKKKKEIGTLRLIEYLLRYCPDNMSIDNSELVAAFDRLIEPRRINAKR